MASNQLTARKIDTAKPREKEYLLADGDCLFLRIRPMGQKDWFFIYSLNGKRSKLAIHVTDLAEARQQANVYRELLKRKIDPKQHIADEAKKAHDALIEAQKVLAALESRITVSGLFDKWEAIVLSKHKHGSDEVRRSFSKDVLPAIGSMAAADVTRAEVMSIVDSMLSRGVNRMAKLVFSQLRQMFRFAEARGYVAHDPTANISKSNIFGRETERERVLTVQEISALASAIPASGLGMASASALWIALATGCRIGEISQARWEHVDLEQKTWLIPQDLTKNEVPFTIHLSDFALKHFQVLKSLTDSAYCIPNREESDHIDTKAITKQVGDRQKGARGVSLIGRSTAKDSLLLKGGIWKPHDLRRTAATVMTQLGVLPEIADRCLNHKEQNRIKRTYLRHSYDDEKRQAWNALGEHLEILTAPSATE